MQSESRAYGIAARRGWLLIRANGECYHYEIGSLFFRGKSWFKVSSIATSAPFKALL